MVIDFKKMWGLLAFVTVALIILIALVRVVLDFVRG